MLLHRILCRVGLGRGVTGLTRPITTTTVKTTMETTANTYLLKHGDLAVNLNTPTFTQSARTAAAEASAHLLRSVAGWATTMAVGLFAATKLTTVDTGVTIDPLLLDNNMKTIGTNPAIKKAPRVHTKFADKLTKILLHEQDNPCEVLIVTGLPNTGKSWTVQQVFSDIHENETNRIVLFHIKADTYTNAEDLVNSVQQGCGIKDGLVARIRDLMSLWANGAQQPGAGAQERLRVYLNKIEEYAQNIRSAPEDGGSLWLVDFGHRVMSEECTISLETHHTGSKKKCVLLVDDFEHLMTKDGGEDDMSATVQTLALRLSSWARDGVVIPVVLSSTSQVETYFREQTGDGHYQIHTVNDITEDEAKCYIAGPLKNKEKEWSGECLTHAVRHLGTRIKDIRLFVDEYGAQVPPSSTKELDEMIEEFTKNHSDAFRYRLEELLEKSTPAEVRLVQESLQLFVKLNKHQIPRGECTLRGMRLLEKKRVVCYDRKQRSYQLPTVLMIPIVEQTLADYHASHRSWW